MTEKLDEIKNQEATQRRKDLAIIANSQSELIKKDFEEYNKLNGTNISSFADITCEGEKDGREIAEIALGSYFDDSDPSDDDDLQDLQEINFADYCKGELGKNKIPTDSLYEDAYNEGFYREAVDVWGEYCDKKEDNPSL